MERGRDRIHKEMNSASDNFVIELTTGTLTIRETTVRGDSSAGAFTTTLPPVAEARGKLFSFRFITDNGDWTITDYGDDAEFADLVFTATGDNALVYSDGTTWFTILSDLT